MNAPALRAVTGTRGKFVWTEEMEEEYQHLRQIMRKQLKLSPYNPKHKLRLVIDVTGFPLIQYIDEKDIGKRVKIINSPGFEPTPSG